MKILNHLKTRLRTTKNVAKLALTGLLFCIPFTASHACSVHDHGCVYHGFNAKVNTSYPTTNTDTSVVMYAIGKTPTTGTPSTVDFDNKAWIPELTVETANEPSRVYTRPTGPYILNNTAYGTSHPPADSYAPDDRYRLVYPSQYQITFNQNSAVARHTGDFNGAENGNIPNATGCPNMPGAANCEAVVVTGNVPTGFYDQQVRIFNSSGNPNPSVDLQYGVYTTGTARLVTSSHNDTGNEFAEYQTISGTGATTPLYRYEVVNTGYLPHAGGTAWFDQNRTYTTGYGKPYTSGSHIYQNRFDVTDTTRTKIYKYGAGEQSLQARNYSTKHLYLGEVAPPPPPVIVAKPSCVQTSFGCFSQESLGNIANTMTMPQNVAAACIGVNCSAQNIQNYSIGGMNAFTLPPMTLGYAGNNGYQFHNIGWRTSGLNELRETAKFYADNTKENWKGGNYLAAGRNFLGVLSTSIVGATFEMGVPESYEGLAVQVGTAGIAKYAGVIAPKITSLIPAIKKNTTSLVSQTSVPIIKNEFFEVNGFKFSEYYYRRLYDSGRRAPSLVALEVLDGGALTAVADLNKIGFYRYNFGGWEMSYNPTTKEIWHLQPIK